MLPDVEHNKRVLILTAGSRGDVQPYIALGCGLQQAGFEVMLATDESFASLAISHKLNFAPIHADFVNLIQTDEGKSAIAGKKSASLMRKVMPMLRQMIDDAWDSAQQYQPNAVIYHPKALAGYHIAEKLGIPGFLAFSLPGYSPTRAFANPMLGGGNYGGFFNQLSYTLFLKFVVLSYRRTIDTWRQEKLGLPPFTDELTLHGQPVPKLYGYSGYVVPVPADWDNTSFVTGYWFLETPSNWQPSADLLTFLERGSAPIYVGFGSMVSQDSAKTTRLVIDAVQKSGQRAILATGIGGLSPSEVPDSIHILESAPHDWLFPHCLAVVHHGGAGTTGAGLWAGKPTVICPFFGDQPFWGKRVFELGVGPRPIPQKKLTVDKLAQAIEVVTSDENMRQQARELGKKIQAENGVMQAVAIIREQLAIRGSYSVD
ncbi:glycosyltransferase family 1 protein [Tolypothrix bouteillei VB521301]|uniref:Glycosyltransferase family 1 protein n=3 Tax=Nostocales TaxID=1161 RepID=A0A0C1NAH1_9CYAN|nr:glycosyltransferase family 1 protein [Tolypothrix bouteillei VB521301]